MSNKRKEEKILDNTLNSLANTEVVERYGSANAEFIKGYTGVNNETGQKLQKGLKDISKSNVHKDYQEQNLRQQAGYSAEVAKTSRDNAENIINKSSKRTERTEDVEVYSQNDPVTDLVETQNGKVVAGSKSQMKFSKDPKKVVDNIAKESKTGKNDWSRYRENDFLDLPSDQVDIAKKHCEDQISKLEKQVAKLDEQGNAKIAAQKRKEIENYKSLKEKIRDSGITTDEAMSYRKSPLWTTTKDIAKTSHRAGIEGAKMGAAIGGGVSLVKNIIAFAQNDKELEEALRDTAIDATKAAALGYGTAAAGATIKSLLQQSSRETLRALSKTNLPALTVSVCLELGKSIHKFTHGEIDTVQFMEEIGEKGSGMLSAGMMATLGQIAIPIPVVGALIGGTIGYTMSSMFYKSSLDAFKEAKVSKENYMRIKAECEEARVLMEHYQKELQIIFDEYFGQRQDVVSNCFSAIDAALLSDDINAFTSAVNDMGLIFGKELKFQSFEEFDLFMKSNEPLII